VAQQSYLGILENEKWFRPIYWSYSTTVTTPSPLRWQAMSSSKGDFTGNQHHSPL
jgi:hypothetical protein